MTSLDHFGIFMIHLSSVSHRRYKIGPVCTCVSTCVCVPVCVMHVELLEPSRNWLWKSMNVHGHPWHFMVKSMDFHDSCVTTWNFIDFHFNQSLAINGNERFVWEGLLLLEKCTDKERTAWRSCFFIHYKNCMKLGDFLGS